MQLRRGRLTPNDFWVLVGFLILVFTTGGGSRADITSLIVLRPVAILTLAYALWRLPREEIRNHRLLLGFIAASIAVVTIQLIPFPPSIWTRFPGHDAITEIDRQSRDIRRQTEKVIAAGACDSFDASQAKRISAGDAQRNDVGPRSQIYLPTVEAEADREIVVARPGHGGQGTRSSKREAGGFDRIARRA